MGQLVNLIELDVSANKLRALPDEMRALRRLAVLNVQHNHGLNRVPLCVYEMRESSETRVIGGLPPRLQLDSYQPQVLGKRADKRLALLSVVAFAPRSGTDIALTLQLFRSTRKPSTPVASGLRSALGRDDLSQCPFAAGTC